MVMKDVRLQLLNKKNLNSKFSPFLYSNYRTISSTYEYNINIFINIFSNFNPNIQLLCNIIQFVYN